MKDEAVDLIGKNPFITGLTTNPTIIKRDKPGWGFDDTIDFLMGVEEYFKVNFPMNDLERFEEDYK